MMLVLNALPHHHHDEAVCVVMERCEEDNTVNDEHTDHSDSDMDHGKSCILGSDAVVIQADNGTRCRVSSCDDSDHVHLFPILYIAQDILINPAEAGGFEPEYGEFVSFYTSAEASQFHGLRAPPISLC
jgi:hypothetical protein